MDTIFIFSKKIFSLKAPAIFAAICFVSHALQAQEIKLQFTDGSLNALEYVTVKLRNREIILFTGVTDHAGRLFLNPNTIGTYQLSASRIGYGSLDTAITISEQTKDLKFMLNIKPKELKSVEIAGAKKLIERKIDRLVFNVENNINTIGADALYLLGKTPMVRVDDNAISLVGKSGVDVLINSRPTHLSGESLAILLRSMNAENISKIEVITNPSAQYDAQGNGGLINIVTKKTKTLGYSGSSNLRFSKATYHAVGGGINMNYNLDKLLTYASLNGNVGAGGPTNTQNRAYQFQFWDQDSKTKEKSKFLNSTFGFDYLLSNKTTIGASFTYVNSKPDIIVSNTTFVSSRISNSLDSILRADLDGTKTLSSKTGNLHLSQKIDSSGKQFVFDADYFSNSFNLNNLSTNTNLLANGFPAVTPPNLFSSRNDYGSKGYTINAMLSLPYKRSSYTIGAKASFVSSNSDVSFAQQYLSSMQIQNYSSNIFRFNENIQAFFGSANFEMGKWAIQAGLRMEATQTKGISEQLSLINRNSYISFFPTFYLTFESGKKNKLSFNYGRRIGRPAFSSFNPYRIYQDQYTYYEGNPSLKPSYTNSFELANTYDNFLTTTLSYNFSNDMQSYIQIVENGSSEQRSIQGNFLSSQNLLFDNSISYNFFPWWDHFSDIGLYYASTSSTTTLTPERVSGFGASFSTSNTFKLNKAKTFTAGIDFTYQFPYTSGISEYQKYYYMDLSAGYLFFKKKLQLGIAGRDIFKTKNVTSFRYTNDIGVYSSSNNDSRRLIVTLKYTFGNAKMKKGQSHNVSSSEQGRSSN